MMEAFGRKSYRKLAHEDRRRAADDPSIQLAYSASERTGGDVRVPEAAPKPRQPRFVSASARGAGYLTSVNESGLPSAAGRVPTAPALAGDEGLVEAATLLNVGLKEWRERSLSIAMHRSRTIAPGPGAAGILRNPTLSSRSKAAEKLRQAVIEASSASKSGIVPGSTPTTTIDLPPKYYTSLSRAPHASLIHIVILYHQVLCRHGLTEEAAQIAALLEGLQEAENADAAAAAAELQGIDLLLRDGLLKLYLRIQPFLPPVDSQIVKFKSLTYTANVFVADEAYETILTKAFHCLLGPFGRKKPPQRIKILKDITGYLMPGTLTLVLGPPDSGKSGLHHVLSGKLHAGGSFEGTITYNDANVRDISVHRIAALVGNTNAHFPLFTVRETLEFARECLVSFKPTDYGPELQEIMGGVLKTGQDPEVELTLSMMGIKQVANRIVGNAVIPSISEDERNRVSAAEMFSGAHSVYFFDELNTVGEDLITYDLLTSIRIFTRVRQITFIASLSQPSSDVFDLFDRLILLNQGRIVYQGPCRDALPYFESLGYKKPKHLSVGEFLEEVTTEDGAAYLQPGFRKLNLDEFLLLYKNSDMHQDICRVIDSPGLLQELWVQGEKPLGMDFVEIGRRAEKGHQPNSYLLSRSSDTEGSLANVSMEHTTNAEAEDKVIAFGGADGMLQYIALPDASTPLNESLSSAVAKVSEPVRLQLERRFTKMNSPFTNEHGDYVLGWKAEALLLAKREFNVTWRNKFGLYIRLSQVLILSLFLGFLLFRVKHNADQRNMNLYRSAFFISVLNMTLFNLGHLPALMDERNIYYKQKGACFYRPISYLLGKIIGSSVFSICEGTIWSFLLYFLTGLSVGNGGRHFFVFYVIIVLTVLNGASMIRFISFAFPDKDKAGVLIGVLVALFILFNGFLLPRFEVPSYWIWMYYTNPLQWAVTALVINEFTSPDYRQLCEDVIDKTNIPQCYKFPNETIGRAWMRNAQIHTNPNFVVLSIVILFFWFMIWNLLAYLSISKIQHARILKTIKHFDTNKVNVVDDVENGTRQLSLVPISVTLSWHELNYDVILPVIKRPRTILNCVSGWGEPNDMVAFIGGQAAGKTTLLNCLAGRKVLTERIGGQILVNGLPKVQEEFGRIMGYVDKIEAYTPYITVKETVAYSAAMRLGRSASKERIERFVEEVLELTELKPFEQRLVVSLINDVTFDQEKRLAIAAELAANPSVIFLDDPIKGLDSSSSLRIIKCLQLIANTGRVVIVTLKYPTQRLLSLFTKVQILKGGETVYFGPAGNDCEMIKNYFEAIPGTPPCPPNKSIPTYAIDVIGSRSAFRSPKDYAFEYRISELALQNHVQLTHLIRSKIGLKTADRSVKIVSTFWLTISSIQRQYWRNINYSWGRMITFLMMSIILGSVYYKIGLDTNVRMNSRAGAIFISCVLVGMTNAQNVIPQMIQVNAAQKRERAVKQAHVSFYNISYTLAEIPYVMVANLLFCGIFCSMTKIAVQTPTQFFKYWFISSEFYVVVTFVGMFLTAVCKIPQIASVIVPILVGMWVPTGGLVVPRMKILPQFLGVYYTNPLQYTLDGLTSVAFYCDIYKPSCLNNRLNLNCTNTPAACPSCDCPRLSDSSPSNTFVWTQIALNRSLDNDRVPYDMMALIIQAIVIRFLTFLATKYLKHNKRT